MKVAGAMTRGEEVVTASSPGMRDDALEYLQECGFFSVFVMKEADEGMKHRGFISQEDPIEHPDEDQLAVLVREAPVVSADDDLEAAVATMASEGAHRIPIVDGNTIEGILTVTDVARAIARGDIDGEIEVGDVVTRDVNTTYVDVPLHIVEHEIFYANAPYTVVLDDGASLVGIMTEVDIIEVARAVEGEASTGDSVADQDDEWMWEGIKAVGNRYTPTRNAEIPAEPVSKFMIDDLASVVTRVTVKDAAQTMICGGIEQTPFVSSDELIGVVRGINLLEALYE